MLIRNKVARTTSPAMTQISIAMPNIHCLLKNQFSVPGSRFSATRYHVQIAHNALRIAVPQKNLAVRSLNMHDLVAPDVSSRAADAANPVATNKSPGLDRITHDRLFRNRSQPESKHPNLNPVAQETGLKSAPRYCEGTDCDHSNQRDRPPARCRWHQRNSDHWSKQCKQNDQT